MSNEQMQKVAFENAQISVEDYLNGEKYMEQKHGRETIGFWLLGVAVGMLIGFIFSKYILI